MLHKRGDGPNIDVWQLLNEGGFSKPLAISTIAHTAWADQISYVMKRKAQAPWLAMVRRPNEVFQPTEDQSQPTNYWRLGGVGLYTHTLTTGNFDKTGTDRGIITNPSDPFGLIYQDLLRLDRLSK